jgi:hypothetical protein
VIAGRGAWIAPSPPDFVPAFLPSALRNGLGPGRAQRCPAVSAGLICPGTPSARPRRHVPSSNPHPESLLPLTPKPSAALALMRGVLLWAKPGSPKSLTFPDSGCTGPTSGSGLRLRRHTVKLTKTKSVDRSHTVVRTKRRMPRESSAAIGPCHRTAHIKLAPVSVGSLKSKSSVP